MVARDPHERLVGHGEATVGLGLQLVESFENALADLDDVFAE
jgi:hypothetical protein